MAVSDTLIGSVFDGRYRIERKLGAGGMAEVYLAEDQELGRRVAIKILNDRHAADDSFVERFRREAKNAAGLSHPNIVSIYDRGEAEGTYYIAMEFLDGRSLKELIVGRGPAPIKVAIDYSREILAAVGFAHKHGIVHRDIKPHNVLVGPEGRLKVTDFGIARSGASQMTEVGSIIGTAQYLSPEQARGAPVDQTSDLYSVGVVLYEMLTGQVPFTGDTPLEIAMKHLSEVPRPPSELRPEVPHDLDSVVLRALAKDKKDRPKDAAEFFKEFEIALLGERKPVPRTKQKVDAKDEDGAEKTLETLVAAYNDPNDWQQMIDVAFGTKGLRDIDAVWLGRLLFLSGATVSSSDASIVGSTASHLTFFGDAQEAQKRGGTGYANADAAAAKDKASLAAQAAAAAKAPNGQLSAALADAYYGYGMYPEAEAQARQAMTKGGARDASEPPMVLGQALTAQGKYDDALAAFEQVKAGGPATPRIVRLWEDYVNIKKNPPAPAAPAAAAK